MSESQQKVVQYLNEAHATERALVRVLQSQIAMTPRGQLPHRARDAPARDARPRRARARPRRGARPAAPTRCRPASAPSETVVGQALALGKTPFDLLRGSGGEEKVLKNAKDACATEALEIATYTALERLAHARSATTMTAALAASIRADEEKMLERVIARDPEARPTRWSAPRSRASRPTTSTKTGAADAARTAAARDATARAKRTARKARKVPGVARAEGAVKGAVASEGDLAIARYDSLTAEEIVGRLTELSQIDLAKVDAYERKNDNRTTVLDRISTLRGDEPWAGYDELTVAEVRAALGEGDEERIKRVREYERAHKNRAGVLEATERELAGA